MEVKKKIYFLSEQKYSRNPCQPTLTGFTRIKILLGQGALFYFCAE